MSKKCKQLWREAHFEVKMYKTHHVRTTFGSSDVEKVHAVVARSTVRSQKCKKLTGMEHFLDVQMFCVAGAGDCAPCQKWAKFEGSCSSFDYNQHYIRLHSTTTTTTVLHYTTLNYTTPHYTTLHYNTQTTTTTTLHYTTLRYRDYTTIHYTNYATLHFASLPYTPLHYTTTTTTTTTTTSTTLQHTTLH